MRWRRAAAIEPRSRAGARGVTTDATAWSCVANQRGPIDALTVSAHTLRSRRYRLDDEQVVGSSSGGPVMRGGRESSPRFVLWWRCSLLREWGSASVARRTLPGARWQVRQGTRQVRRSVAYGVHGARRVTRGVGGCVESILLAVRCLPTTGRRARDGAAWAPRHSSAAGPERIQVCSQVLRRGLTDPLTPRGGTAGTRRVPTRQSLDGEATSKQARGEPQGGRDEREALSKGPVSRAAPEQLRFT